MKDGPDLFRPGLTRLDGVGCLFLRPLSFRPQAGSSDSPKTAPLEDEALERFWVAAGASQIPKLMVNQKPAYVEPRLRARLASLASSAVRNLRAGTAHWCISNAHVFICPSAKRQQTVTRSTTHTH